MVDLGARFSGALLLAGNSAFGVMWGIGGIVGPSIAGITMDLAGPEGLPLTLGVLFGALGLAAGLIPLSKVKSVFTAESQRAQSNKCVNREIY